MTEEIILVDKEDKELGTEEKIKAHQDGGKLHRAFSVFIFNPKGKFMIQKRAPEKYHSGGKWTNTCCSHPRPREDTKEAARRRLREEMGIECELEEVFEFIYEAEFDTDLTEKEYDHVFFGVCDKIPDLDPEEASDWKWISKEKLKRDVEENPESYTPWFKKALDRVIKEAEEREIIL